MSDNPYVIDDYEPRFDRVGTTRRALGFVSDEDHVGGPRNTVERIHSNMAEAPNSPRINDDSLDAVKGHVDRLLGANLLETREDGTLAVTEDGWRELMN